MYLFLAPLSHFLSLLARERVREKEHTSTQMYGPFDRSIYREASTHEDAHRFYDVPSLLFFINVVISWLFRRLRSVLIFLGEKRCSKRK